MFKTNRYRLIEFLVGMWTGEKNDDEAEDFFDTPVTFKSATKDQDFVMPIRVHSGLLI